MSFSARRAVGSKIGLSRAPEPLTIFAQFNSAMSVPPGVEIRSSLLADTLGQCRNG